METKAGKRDLTETALDFDCNIRVAVSEIHQKLVGRVDGTEILIEDYPIPTQVSTFQIPCHALRWCYDYVLLHLLNELVLEKDLCHALSLHISDHAVAAASRGREEFLMDNHLEVVRIKLWDEGAQRSVLSRKLACSWGWSDGVDEVPFQWRDESPSEVTASDSVLQRLKKEWMRFRFWLKNTWNRLDGSEQL